MVKDLIKQCKEVLGEHLIAIIKYGTEGEQNNMLIVTRELSFSILEMIKPIILGYSKRNKVVPVMFTHNGLIDGADVFPLEFLDIIHPHEVVFGEDVLSKIKIDKKHVRRQLEFELRSKLIHLRENYVWIKSDKDLKELLKAAIPSLMPMFYGMLYLKDKEIPSRLDELYTLVEGMYEINLAIFREIKEEAKAEQVEALMKTLERLINIVDKMEIG